MNIEKEYYCFDKIRIISKVQKKSISKKLPLRELKKYSSKCHLSKASNIAWQWGYRSQIEIYQPKKKL